MDWKDRIAIDKNVCHGKPVIKGTRVMVSVLVEAVAGGDDISKVALEYGVTIEDVRAGIAYANSLLQDEQHFPIRSKAS